MPKSIMTDEGRITVEMINDYIRGKKRNYKKAIIGGIPKKLYVIHIDKEPRGFIQIGDYK